VTDRFMRLVKIVTCIRVLASSRGEHTITARDRANEPASSGAYGFKSVEFSSEYR
jgi:hypothetical protein